MIITGHANMETVIEGLHHGILDYVNKGSFDLAQLRRGVERAVGKARLMRENRELLERLTEQNRLMKALQGIAAELAGETYLDRILSRLVHAAKELTGTEAGRVVLLSRTRGETLLVETSVGDGAETIRGARLQLGESLCALVVERAEPLLLARARDHGSYSHRCDELPTTLAGYLCAPLRHGDVFGALTVAGRRAGSLPPEAGDIVAALARHAAVAISGALLNDRSVNFFWEDILPAVQGHHERWDGSGYPWELNGEEIPLGGRIIAVADAFDVMTRNPYGRSRSSEEAILEIEGCAGTHFDPRLARLFTAEYRAHGSELRRYRVAPEGE